MKFFLIREINLCFLAFSSTYLALLLLKCTTFATDFLDSKMAEVKTNLRGYAMQYGTYMGIYWILKFIFFPMGLNDNLLGRIFVILTLGVPVLGYVYVRRFRDRYCEGYISFFKAFAFCFLMYMFASILTAVAHYIYFQYIDNGFMIRSFELSLQQAEKVKYMAPLVERMSAALDVLPQLSPIRLTLELILQNILYAGLLVSFPTALLVMRRRIPVY